MIVKTWYMIILTYFGKIVKYLFIGLSVFELQQKKKIYVVKYWFFFKNFNFPKIFIFLNNEEKNVEQFTFNPSKNQLNSLIYRKRY